MATITWSVFVTAPHITRYGQTAESRARLIKDVLNIGARKVFLEVWRGTVETDPGILRTLRDECKAAELEVATGIMPVRGRDITLEGIPQWDSDTAIGGNSRWGADICYSRPWSREALRKAMQTGAELFDEFIIDDALCTQCTCPRCREAKGDRTWTQFRRDLLLEVCRETLVGTCRKVNPNIKMILKFPQWYDQLATFGYDTARQPAEFDATWIGTETRDPDTPDFGFTPQYEACFNVRWHKAAEPNLEGAWFDYIECDTDLYVEQAYQSLLGGVRNLTLFCYGDPLFRGKGHLLAALKEEQPRLEKLASRLDGQQPIGITAIRPHNPAPKHDGYIFDGLGMLGMPLVPRADFPELLPPAVLLTDHVAGSPELTPFVSEVVNSGGTVFLTASLLAEHDDDEELKTLAGFGGDGWAQRNHWFSSHFMVGDRAVEASAPVEFRFDLRPGTANVLASVSGVAHHRAERIPVVTRQAHVSGGAVVVLNVFGASPADYRMDENLNVPIVLQMQNYPEPVVNVIQEQVALATGQAFLAPARVGYYPYVSGDFVLENFTDGKVFAVPVGEQLPLDAQELLGVATIEEKDGQRGVLLPPRSVALIGR
ncbi:MAG TPA: hypothetical protein PLE60_04450 [Candidatus Latescibacteria bacterium]|nr:hypothetical protein [Candidatus Latescibacterota bacterium]